MAGFWFVAIAFLTLMAFGTVPTPLWSIYQTRDHFGATTVTVAFAVMVVGAAASFRLLGHLSDRFGFYAGSSCPRCWSGSCPQWCWPSGRIYPG